jgi:hypothetical protein
MRTDGPPDGQTDMTKLIVTFRNFVRALKKNVKVVQKLLSAQCRLHVSV